MPGRFSNGAIRKYQKKWTEAGSRHTRWVWQLVVVEHDESGKKSVHARVTDIECSPAKEGVRGKKVPATGKGANRALEALREYREELVRGEQERKRLEAERAEEERRAEAERKNPANRTASDYITEYIDRRARARNIQPSTETSYRTSARYISERWQGVTWAEVTPQTVRKLEADLTAEGFSPSTVRKVHVLLHMVARELVNDGVLDRNPTDNVKPPTIEQKNPNAYSAQDVPAIIGQLDALPNSPCVIAAYLALCAGLRRGEIAGLRWRCVDLDNDVLRIQESIGKCSGGSLSAQADATVRRGSFEKTTKTNHVRDVPITRTLHGRLRGLRREVAQERMGLGLGSDVSALFVIGSIDGRYIDPDVLSKQWSGLAKVLGVVGIEGRTPTLHDLRHTYATTSLAAGVDVKTLASELGHANAAMTLNVYASADPRAKQQAARSLDALMNPKPAEVVRIDGRRAQ